MKISIKISHILYGIFVIGLPISASSFSLPPPAGIIERELEKEYEVEPLEPNKQVPSVRIDIPEERLRFPEKKKVDIATFL